MPLCSQKEVMLPAGFSMSKDLEESKKTLEQYSKCSTMWAVCDRTTHRVIGAAWMDGDPLRRMKMNEARMIGYLFSKECWGKGLATELGEELLRYGFEELGLLVISAGYFSTNQPADGFCKSLALPKRFSCGERMSALTAPLPTISTAR